VRFGHGEELHGGGFASGGAAGSGDAGAHGISISFKNLVGEHRKKI
jgi:hypothetical protein